MILAIGFIMLGGLFVVSIAQLENNVDETQAAAMARSTFAALGGRMTRANTPSTSNGMKTMASVESLWKIVAAEMLPGGAGKYACVPMYRLADGENIAQVSLVVIRSRNRSTFDPAIDLAGLPDSDAPSTFEPRSLKVRFARDATGHDTATFPEISDPNLAAVATGAYLVTADAGPLGDTGGRAVRVGAYIGIVDGESVWELIPGNDLKTFGSSFPQDAVTVLVLGRGFADPKNPARGYSGPAQDVAIFSSFVVLR